MGLFSKKKAAAAADKGKATQTSATAERKVYVPRYAERDGMIGRPTGYKEEEQEAFRRAYQNRMSREMSESSWSLPNPKLSPRLSRNSSAMSMDWALHHQQQQQQNRDSYAGSSRQGNPFATPPLSTRPSSYQSLPHVLADNPPVPAIPQQYASQASSVNHSRNSSFVNPSAPMVTGPVQRPRPAQRHSFVPGASPLGRTPETSIENTPDDTPHGSVNHSSAASTASSASGEVIEIPTKADSPAQYMIDREYPNDPRKWDVPPQSPRTYFSHPAKPEAPATVAAAPKAPAPVKKNRFSMMRRHSPAVAAH